LTAACTSSVDRPRSPANLAAIAIYQSPGANAVATLQAVRARLAELEKRFPEDLAWKVTYDPTTFVTATIEEVEKTLIETFVLVVLVFIFLGSVRATLIPILAVPVSLIGTFIVLKAVGYSANSVGSSQSCSASSSSTPSWWWRMSSECSGTADCRAAWRLDFR
jgi:multidrug efflux pump subunit AcrB